MIAPTLISNFDEIIKKMIFKSEGTNITLPSNVVVDIQRKSMISK